MLAPLLTCGRIAAVLAACSIALGAQTPSRPSAKPVAAMTTSDQLFDDSRVHDLWIRISDADLQRLRQNFEDNTFYRVSVEIGGARVTDVGLRSRGRATRNPAKPGFLLDFNRFTPQQEFLGLKALVLDNAWHDPSMIRERVSMQLVRRLGLAAPREAHARLHLGSARQFAGLYVMVEDIDEQFLRRNYRQDDGYLYEYDRIDGYHLEHIEDLNEYGKRFKPKNHEKDTPEALFGPLRDLARVVSQSSGSGLVKALEPYLDFDRFLTFVAVSNYLAVWDAFLGDLGMANFSVYRFANSTRFEFIPWDYDNTFTSDGIPPWYNVHKNALMRKVWIDPALREQYLARVLQVAESADGWLLQEIDREYAQIRTAARADTLKYRTNQEFEDAIVSMKAFARRRLPRIREFIGQVRRDPAPEKLGS